MNFLRKLILINANQTSMCLDPHLKSGWGWRCETGLSPPVKYFYWPFQGGTSFVDHFCYLCLVFFMFSRLFIAALWSHAGKMLTSWLLFVMFNCVFVPFQCSILGQVWYLIVSIPDLCLLSYFENYSRQKRKNKLFKVTQHAKNYFEFFVYIAGIVTVSSHPRGGDWETKTEIWQVISRQK